MATRRQCLKRKKKRRLSERSEFPTLPVSGAGGACTRSEAQGAIIGVAFSCLLLLLDFTHLCEQDGKPEGFYHEMTTRA